MSESNDKATITPNDSGPYLVRGPIELIDVDGKVLRSEGGFALCRCGQSNNKPFCDGTHRTCGFESTVRGE